MTTVVTSFIAIVLFGMIMIGTINYGDSLGMMAAPDSVGLSQRLQSAVEVVSQVQSSTGSRPRTRAELMAGGMPAASSNYPGEVDVRCTDDSCTPMSVCISLPNTSDNVTAAKAAAGRVKGVVSGVCGNQDAQIADDVVVSMTI